MNKRDLGDVLEGFEDEMYGAYKDTSAEAYSSGPRKLSDWLEGPIVEITESEVHKFIRDMKKDGYAHTTIKGYYTGILKLLEYLDTEHDVSIEMERNPLQRYNIKGSKTNKSEIDMSKYWPSKYRMDNFNVVAFPEEIIQEIIEHAPSDGSKTRNKLLLKLLWQTGIRNIEATRIRWEEDIDQDNREIRIHTAKQDDTSDHQVRYVTYRDNLDTLFEIWKMEQPSLTASDYLFSTQRSERMSKKRVRGIVREAAKSAGYDEFEKSVNGEKRYHFTAHIFRSSYATHCANFIDDIGLDDLKYLLGHSKIKQTEDYILPSPGKHIEASRSGPE